MRVVPTICFALATVLAGSSLPAVSSYAQTASSEAQVCGSGGSREGADHCTNNSSNKVDAHHDFHDHSRSDGRAL
jgi:hypothetical protein